MLAVLQDGGVRFGGARQTIAALAADPQMAGLLETEPRAPLLVITRTVLGADGAPVLMTEARYRGDRYQIRLDLQASGAMHIDS
jgi:GntR family transcriptional regulator